MKTIIATALALILAGCAAQTPPTLSADDNGSAGISTPRQPSISELIDIRLDKVRE